MLLPSIFGNDLFDGFWGFPFTEDTRRNEKKVYGHHPQNLMKTDVQENDQAFLVEMDLPGFKKDDVKVALENGYLTVTAAKEESNEHGHGKYIRRERFTGSCQRSFYVGEEVEDGDIKAEFADGVLKLNIAKKEAKPVAETRKYISIE